MPVGGKQKKAHTVSSNSVPRMLEMEVMSRWEMCEPTYYATLIWIGDGTMVVARAHICDTLRGTACGW